MEKFKSFMKHIIYFVIGYLIFIIFSAFIQMIIFKDMNYISSVLYATKNGTFLYISICFLILIINIINNINLIQKLNENLQKMKEDKEKEFPKEKGEIKMKKRIFITILLIMIIIVGTLFINIARKIIIIKDLQSKISKYQEKDNFYVKIITDSFTSEKFVKDNKIKEVLHRNTDSGDIYIIQVTEDDEIRTYTINSNSKNLYIMKTEKNDERVKVGSYVDAENINELLYNSLVSKIYEEELDGEKCYVIDSLKNTNIGAYVSETTSIKIYLSKETGLAIKILETEENGKENINERLEYKFDCVTDENMEEPDREGLTIETHE